MLTSKGGKVVEVYMPLEKNIYIEYHLSEALDCCLDKLARGWSWSKYDGYSLEKLHLVWIWNPHGWLDKTRYPPRLTFLCAS